MGNQRINRIKDIIKAADPELMEARQRLYPIEYAAALKELEEEALHPTTKKEEEEVD